MTAHEIHRRTRPTGPGDQAQVDSMAVLVDEIAPGSSTDPRRVDYVVETTHLVEHPDGGPAGLVTRREVAITNCRPPRGDGG